MNTIKMITKLMKAGSGLLGLVMLLLFSSCEDSLVEKPKDIVAENYYNTAPEFEAAINAAYSPLRSTAYIGNYIVILDTQTDWGYGRGSRAVLKDWQGLNTNWANGVGAMWNNFYQSIRDANLVIQKLQDGSSISQSETNYFLAEAKFLRALCYFGLVRSWGAVPLRTENNMAEKDLSRSPVEDVYDLITADLIVAESNLPDEQSQIGRPTKFAAKTMLADVYLNLGMYADAAQKTQEVINSDLYSLVPMETRDDWYNILGPEVLTTPEEVFYFKYMRLNGQGNYMPWVINHPSTGLFNFGGAYAHYSIASDPFYSNWDNDDLRKDLWDTINFGLGDSTIVSRKFIDPNAISVVGAGCDMPVYRYAEVLLMYAEASCRAAGGPTAEGMEALNQVHRRAYGEDPVTASAVDFNIADYDEDSFVDQVISESGYEFIFEGKRWYMLKRTGTAAEILLANRGVTIPEKCYLWPIPTSEMNFNDLINPADQNPGY